MIIDFTITNFRSIKDTQTFSCFANEALNNLPQNVAYPDQKKLGVLRTAGIYGANASGKSNVLLAFEALRFIATRSGNLEDGEAISCYEPYLLSEPNKTQPVVFELEFFTPAKVDDALPTRFLYQVSFDKSQIVSESLDFYPVNQKANLFNRKLGSTWEQIEFGGYYKGGKRKFALFDNNSYLAKAGNSADAPEIIRSVYNYLRKNIFHLAANEYIDVSGWKSDPDTVLKVAKILSTVDTGILNIEIRDVDVSDVKFPSDFPDELKDKIIETRKKKAFFIHAGEGDAPTEFTEEMESAGTQQLFRLLPLLLDAFQKGRVLILDELENSLHPHIAELILQLFNDPNVNRNHAQLIFATHNLSLMHPELLRRDQIWLSEKSAGATNIFSLDEFDRSTVKKDSPYGKWYNEGRFGAIPRINLAAISSVFTEK